MARVVYAAEELDAHGCHLKIRSPGALVGDVLLNLWTGEFMLLRAKTRLGFWLSREGFGPAEEIASGAPLMVWGHAGPEIEVPRWRNGELQIKRDLSSLSVGALLG